MVDGAVVRRDCWFKTTAKTQLHLIRIKIPLVGVNRIESIAQLIIWSLPFDRKLVSVKLSGFGFDFPTLSLGFCVAEIEGVRNSSKIAFMICDI